MEEKNPDRKLRPGMAESLHPEIGNGSIWEQNGHDRLLRSPDPSKILEHHLSDPEDQVKIIHSWKQSIKNDGISEAPEQKGPSELSVQPPATEVSSPAVNRKKEDEKITTISPSGDKERPAITRKKTPKSQDGITSKIPPDLEPGSEKTKVPKAGKRVRKAVKTIERNEKAKLQSRKVKEVPAISGPALSPFTQWLKDLKGSDYVHPYEDDFGFNAGSGAGGDVISETYADLLAAQGHKDRAIEMYVRLMEKNPEKSGFFAAKIKALQ